MNFWFILLCRGFMEINNATVKTVYCMSEISQRYIKKPYINGHLWCCLPNIFIFIHKFMLLLTMGGEPSDCSGYRLTPSHITVQLLRIYDYDMQP